MHYQASAGYSHRKQEAGMLEPEPETTKAQHRGACAKNLCQKIIHQPLQMSFADQDCGHKGDLLSKRASEGPGFFRNDAKVLQALNS
jgi:hypothetical protein